MSCPLARTVFLNKYNITCPPYPSVHTISTWALPVTVHAAAQHQLLAIIQFQVQVQISWFLSLFKKQWFKQQPQNLPLGCPACLPTYNSVLSPFLYTYDMCLLKKLCHLPTESQKFRSGFLLLILPVSSLSCRRLNWIWEIVSDSLLLHNQVPDKRGWAQLPCSRTESLI